MNEPEVKITARSISLLVEIKQNLLADNDLSLKISGCGKLAVARYIDKLIANVTEMETLYHDYKESCKINRDYVNEYHKLLRYFPEKIDGDRKVELKALVDKWLAEDEGEDEDG